jgi:GT2 family glycosyltransferase
VLPLCSIIIPVYNRSSVTRQCLNVLMSQRPETPTEIIVVDDGSRDRTARLLETYGDQIRVVTHEVNAGFATACNDGAATAAGDYLVFLNNDTLPQPGWLDALMRYADAHPQAGVVGSKLLYPNDTVQHAGIVVCQDRFTRGIYTGFPSDHPAVNISRRFRAVTGACMLVRRSAFEEAGGFDTAFKNAYEDHDLCLRLGDLGYEVHYCHESVLYHFESVTRAGRHDDFDRATEVFRARWFDRLEQDDLAYYLEDSLLQVTYGHSFPIHVTCSPLLAVIGGEERDRQADRLLERRSHQVAQLLNENTLLSLRLAEVTTQEAVDGAASDQGMESEDAGVAEHDVGRSHA